MFATNVSQCARPKGAGKRGHIVADTLLPTQMFPCLPPRATFAADTNFVSGTQKMFLILFRNSLCPQQMFPSLRSPRNIMGNNVSSFASTLTWPFGRLLQFLIEHARTTSACHIMSRFVMQNDRTQSNDCFFSDTLLQFRLFKRLLLEKLRKFREDLQSTKYSARQSSIDSLLSSPR